MRRLALAVMAIMVFTPCAWAQTMEWQGVNNSAATSLSQNDVDNPDLWHDGTATGVRIPTAGDDVFFRYNSPQTIYRDDLAIPLGSSFEARSISMISLGNTNLLRMPLYLQKNLSLDNVYLEFGLTSGGQGDYNLRIGSADTTATLLLRTADQANINGGTVTIGGSVGSAVLSGRNGNVG